MKLHILFLTFLLLTLPLFFYKLGQTSLVSWDEAWYGEIARNIVKTGDLINLTWNGSPYLDHPPAGFWLMALTYKIFGINEFWIRFPSALSGILSIILLYFIGKKLFNPLVGTSSAIALTSAIWFLFRARSGDLDIILTMFFLLTILLALMATQSKKYLLPFAFSLSLLFLTKTMVPLTIIPPLFLIFYKSKLYKWQDLLLPSGIFLIMVAGWFINQITRYSDRFIQNYLDVGLRGVDLQTNYFSNLKLTREYLHSGIGKWFWPAMISIIFSIFLKQKRLLILILFFFSFILPLAFSPKTQIWHLIPLFPILILIYFGFSFAFLEKYFSKWKYHIYAVILVFSAVIYFNQVRMMWYQFIDISAFTSDEETLSQEASKYPHTFIIDGEYLPTALFYSEKGKVRKAPKKTDEFVALMNSDENFLMIASKWRFEHKDISAKDYIIIREDRDKVLILHGK